MKSKLIITLSILLSISLFMNGYLLINTIPSKKEISEDRQSQSINHLESPSLANTVNAEKIDAYLESSVTTKQIDSDRFIEPELDNNPNDLALRLEQQSHINELIKLAKEAFNANLFVDAVYYYQQVENQSPLDSKELNQQWLSQVHQWTELQQYSFANSMMLAYLDVFPFDEQWLTKQINLFTALKRPIDVIETYILLIENAFDHDKEHLWSQQLHLYAQEQIHHFQEARQWQNIVDMCLILINFTPEEYDYTLAIAEALIYLNEPDKAVQYLDIIQYNGNYEDKVAALYRLIFPVENESTILKLQPYSSHLLIDTLINEQFDLKLMIDTGATLTVITKPVFEQLKNNRNIVVNKQIKINTAGGIQDAIMITVDSFRVGPYTLDDFQIVVIDQEDFSVAEGLLGMNFFKHFIFEIDQNNALLTLKEQE